MVETEISLIPNTKVLIKTLAIQLKALNLVTFNLNSVESLPIGKNLYLREVPNRPTENCLSKLGV